MTPNINQFLSPLYDRAVANKQNNSEILLKLAKNRMLATSDISSVRTEAEKSFKIPLEFNGREYLSFLLHINAEIEHGLMIQYLYAAYSIGGAQIPKEYQQKIHAWQEIILGIAKEEMGHFISVQNILRLIGASLNFSRDDYPWDTPFYPFPFTLEPLTLQSLAKYVYAESPKGWIDSDDEFAKEIKSMVNSQVADPHLVEALFDIMLELIKDPEAIADEAFQSQTYPYQAKFDEWGRGYSGGQRGNSSGAGVTKGSPNVLVKPLTGRDDAYNALKQIAEQGEAPSLTVDLSEASHFERFLFIYKEMKAVQQASWSPSRNIAINPFIGDSNEAAEKSRKENLIVLAQQDCINNPEAKLWAHLFNLRYRMLLNYLSHSFLLDDGIDTSGAKSPRGAIINATFGEMYNLRSIANILVQTPLLSDGDKMAGPPFTIPYVLDLPAREHNRWRLHKDLLFATQKIIEELLNVSGKQTHKYLYSLQEADMKFIQQMEELTLPV